MVNKICRAWFSLEEREGRDIIRRGWGNLWGFPEFGGPVAPLFDDGFLDHAGIGFAIDTHLLGNLDTIGFGDESTREKIQDLFKKQKRIQRDWSGFHSVIN